MIQLSFAAKWGIKWNDIRTIIIKNIISPVFFSIKIFIFQRRRMGGPSSLIVDCYLSKAYLRSDAFIDSDDASIINYVFSEEIGHGSNTHTSPVAMHPFISPVFVLLLSFTFVSTCYLWLICFRLSSKSRVTLLSTPRIQPRLLGSCPPKRGAESDVFAWLEFRAQQMTNSVAELNRVHPPEIEVFCHRVRGIRWFGKRQHPPPRLGVTERSAARTPASAAD